MPLISVIVPVYKTETYLPRCIDSLLAQTLADLEVILVDDGSPDDSGKICDDYAAKHQNVRVIHKENAGVNYARLAGIRAAMGKYLAFVDSDDWVMPDMYADMLQQAEEHRADMVAVGFTRDYGDRLEAYSNQISSGVYKGEELSQLWENAIFDTNAMVQSLAPCVWAKLFRRDTLFETLASCTGSVGFGEDALFTYSALFRCRCVVVMNEHQQYRYQIREGSITNSYYKNYFQDICTVYDKLTESAKPIMTRRLAASIAYNYVFLYLGCVAQELGVGNPASFVDKYRNFGVIAKDHRLGKCLRYVDLSRYSRRDAKTLRLLAAGRHTRFFVSHMLWKLCSKAKKLLKKELR